MLEHELLNAAPIVTGTHRLLGFLSRLFEGKTGSIMRPALMANTLPLDIRKANAAIPCSRTVVHRFDARKPKKNQLSKKLTPRLFRMWVQTWQGE